MRDVPGKDNSHANNHQQDDYFPHDVFLQSSFKYWLAALSAQLMAYLKPRWPFITPANIQIVWKKNGGWAAAKHPPAPFIPLPRF